MIANKMSYNTGGLVTRGHSDDIDNRLSCHHEESQSGSCSWRWAVMAFNAERGSSK